MSNLKVLNLGAGNRIVGDSVNHDLYKHREEIDIVHDLNELPWPWEDKSFDRIVSWAVFEHLNINLLTAVNECWRILKSDGVLHIKLPWCFSETSYDDPTHNYTVGVGVFDIFDRKTKRGEAYSFYHDELGRKVTSWRLKSAKLSKTKFSVVGVLVKL